MRRLFSKLTEISKTVCAFCLFNANNVDYINSYRPLSVLPFLSSSSSSFFLLVLIYFANNMMKDKWDERKIVFLRKQYK